MRFTSGAVVKNLSANAGDTRDAGLIPASGRPPGVGNGNPLHCLENSMARRKKRLVGYCPCGHNELNTTEHSHKYCIVFIMDFV